MILDHLNVMMLWRGVESTSEPCYWVDANGHLGIQTCCGAEPPITR